MDVLKTGPIDENEAIVSMYDYSNHRLYLIYDAQRAYNHHRLRAIDIRYPSLLYDLYVFLFLFNLSFI